MHPDSAASIHRKYPTIGYHVSKWVTINGREKQKPMNIALKEAAMRLGQNAVAQMFVVGPQSYNETLDDSEKIQCKEVITNNDMRVIIHGSYIDHIWNGKSGPLFNLRRELRIAADLGALGVIIHLSSGKYNSIDTIESVLPQITKYREKASRDVMLWLEINSAKHSSHTYDNIDNIRVLFSKIRAMNIMKVGLCIDTAHLFACGLALDSYDAADKYIASIDALNIDIMIHLNDSAEPLGSGRDIHAELCQGNIWGDYNPISGKKLFTQSGLSRILKWIHDKNILTIIERYYEGALRDLAFIAEYGSY